MNKVTYFTEEGLKKLQAELNYLKTKGRAEIAKQIAEARDKGDLSENAEYDAAKEAQGLHELKISKLEESLSSARIIDENDISTGKISVESPIGKGLLGKKMGEKVTVKIPSGEVIFKVINISL